MREYLDELARWRLNQRRLVEDLLEVECIEANNAVCCIGDYSGIIVDALRKDGVSAYEKKEDSSRSFEEYLDKASPDVIIAIPKFRDFYEIANILPNSRVKKAFLLAPLNFAFDHLVNNPIIGRYPCYGIKRMSRLMVILRPVTPQPTSDFPSPRRVPYAWFVFERGHTGAPTVGWI